MTVWKSKFKSATSGGFFKIFRVLPGDGEDEFLGDMCFYDPEKPSLKILL